jgi:hypothetical protein
MNHRRSSPVHSRTRQPCPHALGDPQEPSSSELFDFDFDFDLDVVFDVVFDFDVNLDLNGVATVDARAFLEPPVSSKSVDPVHVHVAKTRSPWCEPSVFRTRSRAQPCGKIDGCLLAAEAAHCEACPGHCPNLSDHSKPLPSSGTPARWGGPPSSDGQDGSPRQSLLDPAPRLPPRDLP